MSDEGRGVKWGGLQVLRDRVRSRRRAAWTLALGILAGMGAIAWSFQPHAPLVKLMAVAASTVVTLRFGLFPLLQLVPRLVVVPTFAWRPASLSIGLLVTVMVAAAAETRFWLIFIFGIAGAWSLRWLAVAAYSAGMATGLVRDLCAARPVHLVLVRGTGAEALQFSWRLFGQLLRSGAGRVPEQAYRVATGAAVPPGAAAGPAPDVPTEVARLWRSLKGVGLGLIAWPLPDSWRVPVLREIEAWAALGAWPSVAGALWYRPRRARAAILRRCLISVISEEDELALGSIGPGAQLLPELASAIVIVTGRKDEIEERWPREDESRCLGPILRVDYLDSSSAARGVMVSPGASSTEHGMEDDGEGSYRLDGIDRVPYTTVMRARRLIDDGSYWMRQLDVDEGAATVALAHGDGACRSEAEGLATIASVGGLAISPGELRMSRWQASRAVANESIPPVADAYLRVRTSRSAVERHGTLLDAIEVLVRLSVVIPASFSDLPEGEGSRAWLLREIEASGPMSLGAWNGALEATCRRIREQGRDAGLDMACVVEAWAGTASRPACEARSAQQEAEGKAAGATHGMSWGGWLQWLSAYRNERKGHGTITEHEAGLLWPHLHAVFLDQVDRLRPILIDARMESPIAHHKHLSGWRRRMRARCAQANEAGDRQLTLVAPALRGRTPPIGRLDKELLDVVLRLADGPQRSLHPFVAEDELDVLLLNSRRGGRDEYWCPADGGRVRVASGHDWRSVPEVRARLYGHDNSAVQAAKGGTTAPPGSGSA